VGGRGRSPWRWALWSALAFVVAGGAAGVWMVFDRPGGNPSTVSVTVRRGDGPAAVVAALERAGLAPHPWVLRQVLQREGAFAALQPGVYELPGDAHSLDIAAALLRPPTSGQVDLMLPPGEALWQLADRVERAGVGTRAEVLALAADRRAALGLLPAGSADARLLADLVGPPRAPRPDRVPQTYLEGVLAADTFRLAVGTPTRETLRLLAETFVRRWRRLAERHRADRAALRARYGLADRDLLVLASLVQEEMRVAAEAPRIAGVFYNRMERGMRFETDPTLMYRPDRVGRSPTPTERKDASNPYNTYAHDGLPPGPICAPSAAAIEGAMQPERHDLLYFVARRDGTGRHAFAATRAEHEANIDRYLRHTPSGP